MYKQVFPSPLRSRTPSIHCGHNAFTHHVFPRLVREKGITVIEELEAGPFSACDFLEWALSHTNDAFPVEDEHTKLSLRDISVTLDQVHEAPLVILTLTDPSELSGAFFIGLVASRATTSPTGNVIRYFTLERANPFGTALFEQIEEKETKCSRCLLSNGPRPTAKAFAAAIALLLGPQPALGSE